MSNDAVVNINDKKLEKNQRAEYGSKKGTKKRTRLTLATPEQVRRYIQSLMLRVENDEITESKARLLTNQAETILKAILQKESDEKVLQLEIELQELIDRKEGY